MLVWRYVILQHKGGYNGWTKNLVATQAHIDKTIANKSEQKFNVHFTGAIINQKI